MVLPETVYADSSWSGGTLHSFGFDTENEPNPTDDPQPSGFSESSVTPTACPRSAGSTLPRAASIISDGATHRMSSVTAPASMRAISRMFWNKRVSRSTSVRIRSLCSRRCCSSGQDAWRLPAATRMAVNGVRKSCASEASRDGPIRDCVAVDAMKFIATPIAGAIVIEPQVFGDARGFFMETWQARKFADAGIETSIGCHTFRATGITDYLTNGGRLEVAQRMAGHANAKTTGLYDRRSDDISVGEVEKVGI